MDGRRFDEWTKLFCRRRSRRAALAVVPALGIRRFLFDVSSCEPGGPTCLSNAVPGCGCPTRPCPAGATPAPAGATPAARNAALQPPCGDCSCRAAQCVSAGSPCGTDHDCCDGSCIDTAGGKVCDCIGDRDCTMRGGSCGCNPEQICTCRVAPACLPLGATCAHDQDCCHGGCDCATGACQCACLDIDASCGANGDCCSGVCGSPVGSAAEGSVFALTCRSATCHKPIQSNQPDQLDHSCKVDSDCCEGICGGGTCVLVMLGCQGRC
jgi:hypothetical protein